MKHLWITSLALLLWLTSVTACRELASYKRPVDAGPLAPDLARALDSQVDRQQHDASLGDLGADMANDFGTPDLQPVADLTIPGDTAISAASEAVAFISVPPSVQPGALESDATIHVFKESETHITKPRYVDHAIVVPGDHNTFSAARQTPLPTVPVASYLIHIDREGTPTQHRRYQGTITFHRPILMILAFHKALNAYEGDFGAPSLLPSGYPATNTYRGLEDREDMLTLSADEKTITVNVQTNDKVDQIRVLVGR